MTYEESFRISAYCMKVFVAIATTGFGIAFVAHAVTGEPMDLEAGLLITGLLGVPASIWLWRSLGFDNTHE